MSSLPDPESALSQRHAQWLAELDPRLPTDTHSHLSRDDTTLLHTVRDAADEPVAQAYTSVHDVDPATLEAAWGPLRQHRLHVLLGDADQQAVLPEILRSWAANLRTTADIDAVDLAAEGAMFSWPTGDLMAAGILPRFGLRHSTTLAVRPLDHEYDRDPPSPPADLTIRPLAATEADVAVAVQLWLGEVRFDAQYGAVHERAATPELLQAELQRRVVDSGYTTWVVEIDGTAVALAAVDGPDRTGWLSGNVASESLAYIGGVYVRPEYRGRGVASALVREVHAQLVRDGVAAVALHFAVDNPLSQRFWTDWGYDPMWSLWRAAPSQLHASTGSYGVETSQLPRLGWLR